MGIQSSSESLNADRLSVVRREYAAVKTVARQGAEGRLGLKKDPCSEYPKGP